MASLQCSFTKRQKEIAGCLRPAFIDALFLFHRGAPSTHEQYQHINHKNINAQTSAGYDFRSYQITVEPNTGIETLKAMILSRTL